MLPHSKRRLEIHADLTKSSTYLKVKGHYTHLKDKLSFLGISVSKVHLSLLNQTYVYVENAVFKFFLSKKSLCLVID